MSEHSLHPQRVLLIMGPTASGKSSLAFALASQTGAVIINADAMQVYRDLAVLSNRPTPEEEAAAPHRLFGHVDGAERFSVGKWLQQARAAIGEAHAALRPAIVIGGTGLYFKALTQGLAPAAPGSEALRAALSQALQAEGAPALHARLAQRDPEGAARLAPQDGVRIVRALEVLEAAGAPLHTLHAGSDGGLPADAWVGLVLDSPRAVLQARIAARFEAMVRLGALGEVARLLARGLDPSLPVMKAHGAPALMAHLRGEISLAEASEAAIVDTRRYAKRQRTWIAHQMADWSRCEAQALQERITWALQVWRNIDDARCMA
ncbi:MAG: tRNA (adenosine(37)-N6)-dimethylallyltransferase MiaA [Hyphomonadaceae bacterium]|nr:tRNA (adenosine(37)-N6)-dimethylallyltransferase MiaA [Hyphomonadaceae bacterium]